MPIIVNAEQRHHATLSLVAELAQKEISRLKEENKRLVQILHQAYMVGLQVEDTHPVWQRMKAEIERGDREEGCETHTP